MQLKVPHAVGQNSNGMEESKVEAEHLNNQTLIQLCCLLNIYIINECLYTRIIWNSTAVRGPDGGIRVSMQSSKIDLEVRSCCCFSQLKFKFDFKQELKIPALN